MKSFTLRTRLSILAFVISFTILNAQVSTKKVKKFVKDGNLAAIKELIEKGQDINTLYKGHSTLLFFAADYGKFEIVKYLVDKGANLDIVDKLGLTPMEISISNFWNGDSIPKYLIMKGANPNIIGIYGANALRSSIGFGEGFGRNMEVFRMLIDSGADINYNCRKCCNQTAFLSCSVFGSIEMIQLLIDKKIDINQTDCKGRNGLMCAIKAGNLEVIKLLIDSEIDKSHKDKKGRTFKDYVSRSKNESVKELFK